MKYEKAKIYIPNKNPMQSGLGKSNKWILEYETKDPTKNPLMGWESSSDTFAELSVFKSKELAINYAKKRKLTLKLLNKKRKTVKKSYADNFLDKICLNFLLRKDGFFGVF